MKRRRIKVRKKENPYPKYSYNSGICYNDGSPCWGIDNKWLMFEIKQGNGLSQLKWEDENDYYNCNNRKRGSW